MRIRILKTHKERWRGVDVVRLMGEIYEMQQVRAERLLERGVAEAITDAQGFANLDSAERTAPTGEVSHVRIEKQSGYGRDEPDEDHSE